LSWYYTDDLFSDPFTVTSRETARALASLESDTVWLWRPGGTHDDRRLIVWTSSTASEAVERWRSPLLIGPGVTADLRLVDGDWSYDLFVTASDNERHGGELMLGGSGEVRRAFATDSGTCALPVLEDANGDGRWDVITYESGRFALGNCALDLPVECRQAFNVHWAVPYIQTPSGFSGDSSLARSYYAQRAAMHRQGAIMIQRAVRNASAHWTPPETCQRTDLADALDSLAFRAQAIGALESDRRAR
jgi:hypothetical protein